MSSIPERKTRNDGKARRRPLGGLPPNSLKPVSKGNPGERLPEWHEIVQPGPGGDAEKKRHRAEAFTATHPSGEHIDIPPAPSGPVRVGKHRARRTPNAAPIVDSATVRPMRGSRTGGYLEVRHGNVVERMAKIRQRPVKHDA